MRLAGRAQSPRAQKGAVLILVLWISFGLVVLSLYFAHSMIFELRAADNRVAATEADHAINGAARYVSHVLTTYATNGTLPNLLDYAADSVPVGEATFWLVGRGDSRQVQDWPVFGLVDEASKLNLNTATAEMLEALPRMTPQLAAAIVDWRDSDSEATANGAEDETYSRLTPPRKAKNAPFESVDELRLVSGATLEILYGEDVNRNGILDANENDGETSPPADNRDGRLDAGILDYVTVYSREMNTRSDGSARINVNTGAQQLTRLLQEKFGQQRATDIGRNLGPGANNFRSLLEFYARSRMTADEFAQIHTDITTATGTVFEGLVNVNTASEAVLGCIPGIGVNKAASLVAFRLGNPGKLTSSAWVTEVLDENSVTQAGPYLTAQAHQFTADIAAVGRHGRGFRRMKFVFDTTEGAPKILYRQDLTHEGWVLGARVREEIQLAKENRR